MLVAKYSPVPTANPAFPTDHKYRKASGREKASLCKQSDFHLEVKGALVEKKGGGDKNQRW